MPGTDQPPWDEYDDARARLLDARRRVSLLAPADRDAPGSQAYRMAVQEAELAEADVALAADRLGQLGALLIDHATRGAVTTPYGDLPHLTEAVQARLREGLGVADVEDAVAGHRASIAWLRIECAWLRHRLEDRDRETARLRADMKELREEINLWVESGLSPDDLRTYATPRPAASAASAGTAARSSSAAPAASAGIATTIVRLPACTLRRRSTPIAASGT